MKILQILCMVFVANQCFALDAENYLASRVDLTGSKANLLQHKEIFFGLSCRSGVVSEVPNLGLVSLGDTIRHEKFEIKVGLIDVMEFNEDLKYKDKFVAKKGDVVCVISTNKESMPGEEDCDALWIRAVGCKTLQKLNAP